MDALTVIVGIIATMILGGGLIYLGTRKPKKKKETKGKIEESPKDRVNSGGLNLRANKGPRHFH